MIWLVNQKPRKLFYQSDVNKIVNDENKTNGTSSSITEFQSSRREQWNNIAIFFFYPEFIQFRMYFHPEDLKSERNNPWFKPWFNILLHTQSIVCATVDSQCLEYLGYMTLMLSRKYMKYTDIQVLSKRPESSIFKRKPKGTSDYLVCYNGHWTYCIYNCTKKLAPY